MGWIYNQLRFSAPQGVDNVVVCRKLLSDTPFPWEPCIETDAHFPLRSKLDLVQRKMGWQRPGLMSSLLSQENAEVLHSHFGHVGWEDHPAAKKSGSKHIVTVYGNDISLLPAQNKAWKKRYASFFDSVDMVLCEGKYMREQVIALGAREDNTQVHHLGVILEDLPFLEREFPRDSLRVLVAAGFRQKKGIPDALKALGILKKKGISLSITLVGQTLPEERSRAETLRIEQAILDNNLESDITRHGFLSPDAFHRMAMESDVFLSPSRIAEDGDTEGGAPVALLEMAAMGLAIVSTTHCDIPNMLPHGTCSLLSEERNPESVAQNLERLLEEKGLFESLTKSARSHVETEYDARKQGIRLAEIYGG